MQHFNSNSNNKWQPLLIDSVVKRIMRGYGAAIHFATVMLPPCVYLNYLHAMQCAPTSCCCHC